MKTLHSFASVLLSTVTLSVREETSISPLQLELRADLSFHVQNRARGMIKLASVISVERGHLENDLVWFWLFISFSTNAGLHEYGTGMIRAIDAIAQIDSGGNLSLLY